MKTFVLMMVSLLFAISSEAQNKSFYDFTVKTIDGKDFPLSSLKGKKVLVVKAAVLRQPLSRRLRRVRPTLTSTPQPLRIIRQAVLPQVVQTPVRPAAKAKDLNQPAALPARTILATALNSPRIDWLGC